jgi:TetR/AcrR family transcriptional repressor of nem operon
LDGIIKGWQQKVAHCLELARGAGEIGDAADCDVLAEFFWIGWEGAVMRARLVRNGVPLDTFISGFIAGLPRPDGAKPPRSKRNVK